MEPSVLREFTLTYDHPVEITRDQIETIASKWPSLESFILACEPVHLTAPCTLTLLALLPFARYCPNIRILGLFINASTADLPMTTSSSTRASMTNSIKRFQNLTKLSMGVSQIKDEGSVALFLSHLLPLGCDIECGVTWHSDLDDMAHEEGDINQEMCAQLIKEVGKRCAGWNEVGRMLPLLIRLRMEERERLKGLEETVDDLRIRNRILMERAGKSMEGDGTCVIF